MMKRVQSNSTSNINGVSWCKRTNKWEIRYSDFLTGKRKYGGMLKTKEDVEIAYKKHREYQVEIARDYMRSLGYSDDVCMRLK